MENIKLFEEFVIKNRKGIKRSNYKGGTVGIIGLILGKELDKFDKLKGSDLDKLEKVMQSFVKKFGLNNKVKYLNSGSFGMAFGCGNYVVKLTSNIDEVEAVENLIGKKIDGCVNYYKILYNKKHELWAILLDRVTPLDQTQKLIVNDFINYAVEGGDDRRLNVVLPWLSKRKFKDFLKFIKIKVDKDHPNYAMVEKIFLDLVELIKKLSKYNISLRDLHQGNIGYKGGKMIAFDIM